MVPVEVYERIEHILTILQHNKDTLDEQATELLYDELEKLCGVILNNWLNSIN
ncbi:hypothetical protein [Sporomusa aerivorans]|uniref:hypothetical protein n=1 Tax=Sporomusa aerivorans TaxID=204936 RepID=UPI00352B0C98